MNHLSGDGREFVKRLVGLPNETIEVRDGLIFINDTLLGVRIIRDFSTMALTIPDNQYFWVIIGPPDSIWACVPREAFIGHAYLTLASHIQTLSYDRTASGY